jgi:hypothetical protein
MAKKKKSTRKAVSNRGGNPGRASNSRAGHLVPLAARVSIPNKDWLTERSEAAGISRSGFLDKLLTTLRETEAGMLKPGGLFDAYSVEMERIVDNAANRLRERAG